MHEMYCMLLHFGHCVPLHCSVGVWRMLIGTGGRGIYRDSTQILPYQCLWHNLSSKVDDQVRCLEHCLFILGHGLRGCYPIPKYDPHPRRMPHRTYEPLWKHKSYCRSLHNRPYHGSTQQPEKRGQIRRPLECCSASVLQSRWLTSQRHHGRRPPRRAL